MKECVALYGRHRMNVIKYEAGFISYCEMCGEGEWTNLRGSKPSTNPSNGGEGRTGVETPTGPKQARTPDKEVRG